MAQSSFDKDFTLKTKKEVESLVSIMNNPIKGKKIDRELVNPEKVSRGEQKVKQMLERK